MYKKIFAITVILLSVLTVSTAFAGMSEFRSSSNMSKFGASYHSGKNYHRRSHRVQRPKRIKRYRRGYIGATPQPDPPARSRYYQQRRGGYIGITPVPEPPL